MTSLSLGSADDDGTISWAGIPFSKNENLGVFY